MFDFYDGHLLTHLASFQLELLTPFHLIMFLGRVCVVDVCLLREALQAGDHWSSSGSYSVLAPDHRVKRIAGSPH